MSPELRWRFEDLYARYAALLDDGPLEQWPALFTAECSYRIVPRENYELDLPLAVMRCDSQAMLRDRVRAVQQTVLYEPRQLRHQITQIQPARKLEGCYRVTANYSVIEVLLDELPRVLSVGRYVDEVLEDDEGTLRFVDKRVIYDSDMVPNTIVFPL